MLLDIIPNGQRLLPMVFAQTFGSIQFLKVNVKTCAEKYHGITANDFLTGLLNNNAG